MRHQLNLRKLAWALSVPLALAALVAFMPTTQAAQGSDAATGNQGYVWRDITMNYVEIRGTGVVKAATNNGPTWADFNYGEPPTASAFTFNLYGTTYGSSGTNDAHVSDNGFISLSNAGATVPFGPLPSTAAPNNMIAPFTFDGRPDCPGLINPPVGSTNRAYADTIGSAPDRIFIAEWDGLALAGEPVTVTGGPPQAGGGNSCQYFETLQLKLFEGSDIMEFHNKDVKVVHGTGLGFCPTGVQNSNTLQGSSIGIEDSTGAKGLRYYTYNLNGQCSFAANGMVTIALRIWDNDIDAQDETVTVNMGATVVFTPKVSDDPLTYTQNSSPAQGTFSGMPAAGQLQYGKKPTFTYVAPATCGLRTMKYTVADTYDAAKTATITFDVLCPNDPPVNSVATGLSVSQPNALQLTGGMVTVSDPDAGTGSLEVRLQVGSGKLDLNPAGVTASGTIPGTDILLSGTLGNLNTALGTLTFAPTPGQCGAVLFTMTTNDLGNTGVGGPLSDIDTRQIAVTGCVLNNGPPSADSFLVTLVEGQKSADVLLSGTDPEGAPLTFEVLAPLPTRGVLSGVEPSLKYTRSLGACGSDTLTYRVIDSVGQQSPTATVSLTLLCPPNRAPTVQDLGFDVKSGQPRSFTLLATDLDGGTPSTIVVTLPSRGSLSGNAPSLTYTPDPGYCGYDSFQYIADDGQASSDPGVVTLRVVCIPNMAPVAEGDHYVTDLDAAVATPLFAYDPDGEDLLYILVDAPANGEVHGTMPMVSYDPHSTFSGVDRFTYRVFDGEYESGLAIVTIEVRPAGADDGSPADQPAPAMDWDDDGFADAVDNCPSVPSGDLSDVDGDGVGDVCDPAPNVWGVTAQPELAEPGEGDLDADGDFILDARDLCPTVWDPAQEDFDGDRRGDVCDGDRDGDTIPNGEDNCRDLASLDLSDHDADGSGDVCDPDDDNDGLPDTSDLGRPDNCPRVPNPAQQDADGDAVGDICDADADGSGMVDQACLQASCRAVASRTSDVARAPGPGGLGATQAVAVGASFAVFALLLGFTLHRRRLA